MSAPPDVNQKPLIGITMGDPLGVGPEVIVKALANDELRRSARFVIFGLHEAMELAADQCEMGRFWWREPYDGQARVGSGVLVADFDDLPQPPMNGHEANETAGHASFRFVEEGIRHLRGETIDALVTGPISKTAWHMARHAFRGHTDLLQRRFEARRVTMAFVADELRVALASDHTPLFDVRHGFTIGMVHQPIDLLDRTLREWFGIKRPRIGVLGVNPHAGENGLLGDEEHRIIEPALTLARNANIDAVGPLPPDTAFVPEVRAQFQGLVAMYHDQGLIPIKMHAFHRAVNLTLGLGAIRTSPDHGTAFELAGCNKANPGSMIAAIELAIRLARVRNANRPRKAIASS